ncbi:signal protein PDZ [Clostridium weizhouense]|uniref:Signal protein PDZ n=1 Tax=Clostridium weizhouense TaxID=2859781 RepID=A0ABS7ARX1_9CLOT|nr:signal protein PDZ [Clostridium weizhouense]MBW6411437.1 signal protein PDZ [Clostridium weizhouense]
MDLLLYTLRGVAEAIVEPTLMLILILLGVILYLKNRKLVIMQKMILGESVNTPLELTLSQIVLGILAGTMVSVINSMLGIRFGENSGIFYLFGISIVLMFIKPRFICFSYSGAILGLISVGITLLGNFIPGIKENMVFKIDIMYLMTFVGVLHIIEGLLVMIDGDRGSIPVFANKGGKIIGGFALNRYWLLSIAILISVMADKDAGNYITTAIQTPNSWPFIHGSGDINLLSFTMISIMPLYAVLGYSSVTFTKNKREKALSSGKYIIAYGLLLTLVSQVARFGIVGELLLIIFAPLGHELMIRTQKNREDILEPKFMSDEEGLVILDVLPKSIAYDLGIKAGSKLLSVNDKIINSQAEMYSIIKENLYNITLKIKDMNGTISSLPIRISKGTNIGMLLVPRAVEAKDKVMIKENDFSQILDKLKESDKLNNDKKN